MSEKLLKTHYFNLSPDTNGGESLSLTTKYFTNGDDITITDGVFVNQELTLQSYCNAATFNLIGSPFTPELLRKLANELESERMKLVKN